MGIMNLRFNRFYAADGGVGTSVPDATGTSTPDDDLYTFELLNAEDEVEETESIELDDSDEPSPSKEDKVDEEEEEEDPLKELEEELKEPTEEDLELTTPVRRKEILAKYPQLFKDFPYLEKAYYREQQFTEVFPTIQDARTSAEKAGVLDQVEREVMSGYISSVLSAARSENQDAFYKVVDNYLPALRKVDSQAYFHVLGNVIKDTIITMVKEGRQLGDQGAPLQAAANVLNQFVFGSQTFTPPQQLSRNNPQVDQQQQQFYEQQRQQVYTKFEETRESLQ